MSQQISNMIGVAVTLQVGLNIMDIVNKWVLYATDYQAYVEQYLIPEQVFEANKWLKRSPRYRIVIP